MNRQSSHVIIGVVASCLVGSTLHADLVGKSVANVGVELNGDEVVNWVDDEGAAAIALGLRNSYLGGSLRGDVDSVWSQGDFDGNGRTSTGDLVAALSGGGYEVGPRAATAVVPEPSAVWLFELALPGTLGLSAEA